MHYQEKEICEYIYCMLSFLGGEFVPVSIEVNESVPLNQTSLIELWRVISACHGIKCSYLSVSYITSLLSLFFVILCFNLLVCFFTTNLVK